MRPLIKRIGEGESYTQAVFGFKLHKSPSGIRFLHLSFSPNKNRLLRADFKWIGDVKASDSFHGQQLKDFAKEQREKINHN